MILKARHYLLLLGLIIPWEVAAQGTISTVAGGSSQTENVQATLARLDGLRGIAVDPQGTAYISDGARIRRVDAVTGLISTVAGDGKQSPVTDGQATQVSLAGPGNLAVDPQGNLVFLDNNRVAKLDLQAGTVTTIAGQPGSTPQFGSIAGLALDRAGNIFVADDYNARIFRVDAVTGAVATFAGVGFGFYTGTPGGEGGPATEATLGRPYLVTVDSSGNVFFAEQYWLRRIDAKTGIVTTIMPFSVGRVYGSGTGDGGPVGKAVLGNASALATDSNGDLYIADGPRIRKIHWSTGIISAVAGSGQSQFAEDGVPALQANLSFMYGVVIDRLGNLWLADQGNGRLFEVSAASGLIRTVAGTSRNGDGGPALSALLPYSYGIAANANGDLYVNADGIRRIDHVTGRVTTVARAEGLYGRKITVDSSGAIFFTTTSTVERIDPISGKVTTVAGLYYAGFEGDGGPAANAAMAPAAVAVDPFGNLYVADYWNYRIRRVDAKTGIIDTIAGNGRGQTYSGEVGRATQISIGVPTGIAVHPSGDVYWTTPNWVLRVDSNGVLSVAAGNGGCYSAGDGGPAVLASLCQPNGPAFDSAGNMFIGEGSSRVRRVSADSGIIQTVAGTGGAGVSVDSIPATQAALTVAGIALAGNTLYIIDQSSDETNARIRAVAPATPPALPQPPKITQIVNALALSPGSLVSVMGHYLGPADPVPGELGLDGRITNTLAGDQVTFQGLPGPLLYVSAAQIDSVVPYASALGRASVQVKTAAGTDTLSDNYLTQVSPSFFAGLIYNPDGTLNRQRNPAPKGATLEMYGTGIGQTSPAGVDGAILQGPNLPQPVNRFSATVLSGSSLIPADILYIGPRAGFVAGTAQANIRIPASAQPGASSLFVTSLSGYGTGPLTIFMMSDPPVLTSTNPASPIPQTLGLNYLELTGRNLNQITAVNFFFDGSPFTPERVLLFGCTGSASCIVYVNFAGRAGDYSVEVVNAANQMSNRLDFTVAPVITAVVPSNVSGSLVAKKGSQPVMVIGTNFQAPSSGGVLW